MNNVLAFPKSNLNDIPYMLRLLADEIEQGKFGTPDQAMLILDSEKGIKPFLWGDASDLERIGLLEQGKAQLLRGMLDVD